MNNIEFAKFLLESEVDKTESLKLDIAFKLDQAIASSNLTRSALAKKIGASPAWITKVLRGDVNLTLETIMKLSDALDLELNVHFSKRTKLQHSATLYNFSEFKHVFKGAKEFKFSNSINDLICNDLEFENVA